MPTAPDPFPERFTYAARVVSVHDADTIRAYIDFGFEAGQVHTLRLLGIQAPEVGGANVSDAEKAAGIAARDVLAGLLLNAVGRVFVKTKKDTQEGRGRYLATIFLAQEGGLFDVNALLVAEGHAVAYDGRGKAPKWTPTGWVKA